METYQNLSANEDTGIGNATEEFVNSSDYSLDDYFNFNFNFFSDLSNFGSIVSYIILVIAPLGLIFNASFMIVVALVASMRTTVNFYLVNLAIADTTFLTMKLIETGLSISDVKLMLLLNPVYVGINEFLINLSVFASLFIVLVVSLERYLAICWSTWIIRISSRRRTALFICIAWGLAQLMATLIVVNFYVDVPQSYSDFVNYIFLIFLIVVPMTVIFLYILIARAMKNRQKYLENIHTNSEMLAENKDIIRLLVATIGFFFLLESVLLIWIIYQIITPVGGAIAYDLILDFKLGHINSIFLCVKSSCNSIIYTMSSKKYREAFKHVFTPGCLLFQRSFALAPSSVETASSKLSPSLESRSHFKIENTKNSYPLHLVYKIT